MIWPRSDSISRGQLVSLSCASCAWIVVAVKSVEIASKKAQEKLRRIRIEVLLNKKDARSLTLSAGSLHLVSLGLRGVRRRTVEKAEEQTVRSALPDYNCGFQAYLVEHVWLIILTLFTSSGVLVAAVISDLSLEFS